MARPLLFKSKEDLQSKIDAYFSTCWEETEIKNKKGEVTGYRRLQVRPYTVTGLAVALDTSRQTLVNYEEKEEFFDTIKKAKDIIENWTEEQLYRNTQVTGVIFNLKNNYDWKDKQEVDHTTRGESIKEDNIDTDAITQEVVKRLKEQKI